MSLQIWLPLNGSLENKGCCNGNFTVVTTPTYVDNGKIGKALSGGQITMSADTTASILNNDAFSFCCWVYVNTETGDTTKRAPFFGNESMGELNNRKFSVFQYPSCNDLHINCMNDGTTVFASGVWYGVLPSYQWTHIAITYQNPTLKVYINGVLLDTKTGVSQSSTFAYQTALFKHVADDGRYLNDYRLYDTCLSAAEVREIAQGLVLHYKLDMNSQCLNWLNPNDEKKIVRASGNTFLDYPFDQTLISCTDTGYTVEYDAKGTADDIKIDMYFRNSSGAAYAYTDIHQLTTDWKHYKKTITGSPSEMVWFRVRCYGGTAGDEVYLKNVRLYSENMPLESTAIIDSSGYGHHGYTMNTVSATTDTPRYLRAVNLPDDNSVINCGRGGMVTDSLTFSIWAKRTSSTTAFVSCTEGGGFSFSFDGQKVKFWLYINGVGYKTPVTTSILPTNEWHMITGVYDRANQKVKVYFDGELESSLDSGASNPISYHASNVLWIGAEATGSSTTFTNGMCGKYSDFRIYCTALSDDAIRDLYHTSAKIDKSGKWHSFEYVEDTGSKILKSGITQANIFIQNTIKFNDRDSYTVQPITGYNRGVPFNDICMVDYGLVANLGIPITVLQEADITWENYHFINGDGEVARLQTQGARYKKGDMTSSSTRVWTGTAYAGNLYNITSYVQASASGTIHMDRTYTIPASWLETYDKEEFSLRSDYSDGNGTVTISNIKITPIWDTAKIHNAYISANDLIER